MLKNEAVGPGMIDPPGLAGRVGRAVVGTAEQARAQAAADRAARQEMLRPALAQATRHARQARADEKHAQLMLQQASAALVLGDGDEAAVEAIEREIAEAERDAARYEAAVRE